MDNQELPPASTAESSTPQSSEPSQQANTEVPEPATTTRPSFNAASIYPSASVNAPSAGTSNPTPGSFNSNSIFDDNSSSAIGQLAAGLGAASVIGGTLLALFVRNSYIWYFSTLTITAAGLYTSIRSLSTKRQPNVAGLIGLIFSLITLSVLLFFGIYYLYYKSKVNSLNRSYPYSY